MASNLTFDKSKQVSSSQLRKVEYCTPQQILRITFTNNSVYDYKGVPANIHAALIAATSVGSFFSRSIKNVYQYQQV